ncbi:WD40 domain-containing protein [Psychroserpens sp. MEBiC05023]
MFTKKLNIISLFITIVFWTTNIWSQKVELGIPLGHSDNVSSLCYSPCGNFLLSASYDGDAKLWDLASGKLIHTLEDHTSLLYTASFSPDGNQIITASADGTAKLWETDSGNLIHTIQDDKSSIIEAIFSPDGKLVLTSSFKGKISLWDSKSGKHQHSFGGKENKVYDYFFTQDSKSISLKLSNELLLWNIETRSLIYSKPIPKWSLQNYVLSNDDKLIAGIHKNGLIFIMELASGKIIKTLNGHNESNGLVNFSYDSKSLIISYNDGTVEIWNIAKGKLIKTVKLATSNVLSVKLTYKDKYILTRSRYNGEVKLWNLLTGKMIKSFGNSKNQVVETSFNLNKTNLILAYKNNEIKFWEIEQKNFLPTIRNSTYPIKSVAFSNDSKRLLLSSFDNSSKLLNLNTGKLIHVFKNHKDHVNSSVFSPDYEKILTASKDGTAKLWNAKSGNLIHTFSGHKDQINSAIFSPNGEKILTASKDGMAKVWDINSGTLDYSIITGDYDVNLAIFSSNGEQVVTCSKQVRLWSAITGKLLDSLGGGPEVLHAKYLLDGSQLITATNFGEVNIWNNKKQKLTIKAHTAYIRSIEFSTNEEQFLTSSPFDNKVKIWDLSTGNLIKEIQDVQSGIVLATYSSNSNEILTTTKKGDIKSWNISTGNLINTMGNKSNYINSISISPNKAFIITASDDGSITVLNASTNKYIMKQFFFDGNPNKWVHLHPSGLFDASPEAMKLMYWTKGLDIIEFEQIKEFYWEPGLWEKVMNNLPLKEVPDIQDLKLPPEVVLGDIKNNTLPIHIKKLDGGYGNLSVFVNDVKVDQLQNQIDKTKENQTVYYKFDPNTDFSKGKNTIQVIAESDDGLVKSRGAIGEYINNKKDPEINFYGIFVGVEDYPVNSMDLSFPVKDVKALSSIVSKGANNLYSEKTHIYKYVSNHSSSDSVPTKKNIKKAFQTIQSKAKVDDIIFVYLSGHGATFHKANNSEFLFLPENATSINLEKYQNDFIRAQQTISGNEINDWLYKIKANKRVMILDACGSGIYTNNQKKSIIDPSREKVLKEMVEVSGLSILVSSAADKASYESSSYGQGLLTYAILEGIKQQTQDNKVRSYPIMQHAQERVPELAKGISAIQKPELYGDASITFGILNASEKDAIILPSPKKIMVLPRLSNSKLKYNEDDLGLTEILSQRLISYSDEKGVAIKYIPQLSYSGAYRINGTYQVENDFFILDLIIIHEKEKVTATQLKASTPRELIELIIDWVGQSLNK